MAGKKIDEVKEQLNAANASDETVKTVEGVDKIEVLALVNVFDGVEEVKRGQSFKVKAEDVEELVKKNIVALIK